MALNDPSHFKVGVLIPPHLLLLVFMPQPIPVLGVGFGKVVPLERRGGRRKEERSNLY
jgi:hypothetical protein